MGRHEEIIAQGDVIKSFFADDSVDNATVRRIGEYIYNREVALKKIINVMAFGKYTSKTHIIDETLVYKEALIDDKEMEKANPHASFDRDVGRLLVKVMRYR